VARALHTFTSENERPTLIVVHSHIGYGSPVEDTPKAHGEPFGVEGVKSPMRFLGIPEDKDLFVPGGVYEHFAAGVGARGREARTSWEARFEAYRTTHLELADELGRIQRRCVWGEGRGPMGSTASARPSPRSATTRRRTR
jgi:transketolase